MQLVFIQLLIGAALAASPSPRVALATHRGVWNGAQIDWTTTAILSNPNGGTVTFAQPLPAAMSPLSQPVQLVRNAAGDIVELSVEPGVRTVGFRLAQPLASPTNAQLWPPLLESDQLQRVTLEGLRYEPDQSLGIEKHLRYSGHPEATAGARRELDRSFDNRRARARDQPIYVIADERIADAGGLVGNLYQEGRIGTGVSASIALVFGLFVGSLFLMHNWLGRYSKRERIDAYMEKEFVWPAATTSVDSTDSRPAPEDGVDPVGCGAPRTDPDPGPEGGKAATHSA